MWEFPLPTLYLNVVLNSGNRGSMVLINIENEPEQGKLQIDSQSV